LSWYTTVVANCYWQRERYTFITDAVSIGHQLKLVGHMSVMW